LKKYIFLVLLLTLEVFGAVVKAPIIAVDEKNDEVKIQISKIDVGMSGFIIHHITKEHSSILKNVEVKSFDAATKTAVLTTTPFTILKNSALPSGKWKPEVGDTVELAFNYSRALLIAPTEEIYHRITKSVQIEWVHPDLFATVLSFKGHPTPLKSDFKAMSIATSVGLLFVYLEQKVYTLDIRSFKILNISDAPLKEQKDAKLPFYSRVEKIDAAWFGEGSDEMKSYSPHYYELLVQNNKTDKKLYEIIKNGDKKLHYLLKEFEVNDD